MKFNKVLLCAQLCLLLTIPAISHAFKCSTINTIKMKNSCPFPLEVIVNDEGIGEKKVEIVQPGEEREVASATVSKGTLRVTDGIANEYAEFDGKAKGNWWDGCKWEWSYWHTHGFDDTKGLDEGLNNYSKHGREMGVPQRLTVRYNLTICANGYAMKPDSIGLGRMNIEINHQPHTEEKVVLNEEDLYIFSFSSIGTSCKIKYDHLGGYYGLSCSNDSIKGFFMNDYKNLVFMCQQVDSKHSNCPWINQSIDSTINDSLVTGYH
ncbi:hypothetical protein L3V83_02450 [Thiotrichales bacterium 19X7-9]|nr:hypothetical protein [Thiotrichales bacterium 19X7-9]